MFADQAQFEKNIEEQAAKMKACRERGRQVGYSEPEFQQPAIHLDSGEGGMTYMNGITEKSCANCGMPYYKSWTREDWESHRRMMETVITI